MITDELSCRSKCLPASESSDREDTQDHHRQSTDARGQQQVLRDAQHELLGMRDVRDDWRRVEWRNDVLRTGSLVFLDLLDLLHVFLRGSLELLHLRRAPIDDVCPAFAPLNEEHHTVRSRRARHLHRIRDVRVGGDKHDVAIRVRVRQEEVHRVRRRRVGVVALEVREERVRRELPAHDVPQVLDAVVSRLEAVRAPTRRAELEDVRPVLDGRCARRRARDGRSADVVVAGALVPNDDGVVLVVLAHDRGGVVGVHLGVRGLYGVREAPAQMARVQVRRDV